jgi:23S rRNA pseudouridine1911/1915/1917 synthase
MKLFQLELEIKESSEGRLDQLLLARLREIQPALSRATLKSWFQEKRVTEVFTGGERKLSASDSLKPGKHQLRIQGFDPSEISTLGARASTRGSFLEVVYEDNQLLVLNKTSGVPSVPHAPEETETAVGAALARIPEIKDIGRAGLEPGILHRLDTGTSGLLAFAKTSSEYERLRSVWSSGEVRKTYRALVASPPHSPLPVLQTLPLELRFTMAHDARSAKRMVVLDAPMQKIKKQYRGKPLPTLTRILSARKLESHPDLPEGWDLEIQIQTGVMHQIRCTLASLGIPILGDTLYQGRASSRLWLHAWKLELPLKSGENLTLEAPLPEGWLT